MIAGDSTEACTVGWTTFTAVPAGLFVLVLLAGRGMAQDREHPAGQELWRSCSSCHCVPVRLNGETAMPFKKTVEDPKAKGC